jgi:Uma2 family endonuclease
LVTTLVIPTDAPAVVGPGQGRWTYADWQQLPDDGNRYEIIDGVLYMTTAPRSFHQWIVGKLHRYIGMPAEDRGLAFAFAAPIGLLMPGCDPAQPDYVVINVARAAILRDGRIMGVPDLIIEILSSSNRAYDETIKLEAYARARVPEYAIVDPRDRRLLHHRLEGPDLYADAVIYGEADTMQFDCLPGIAIPVSALFSGAPDTTL